MPHLGFKPESSLPEFFRRDLLCSIGRPADNGCNAAAIFEQPALVLGLEAHVGETGEMQHRPEAIVAVREVMARDRGAQGRVEAAEDHIKAFGQDIRLVVDQANLLPAPLQMRAFSVFIHRSWSHRRAITRSIDREALTSALPRRMYAHVDLSIDREARCVFLTRSRPLRGERFHGPGGQTSDTQNLRDLTI
jgi:hypothetical protein